jgi:hypothetical protein
MSAVAEQTDAKAEVPAGERPSGDAIAILGCGPAGLIAAWTLEREGIEKDRIKILSKSPLQPSPISGAQFLHQPIGMMADTPPDGQIEFCRLGSKQVYAEKIYNEPGKITSWEVIEPKTDAWKLDPVYSQLWRLYEDNLIASEINSSNMQTLIESGEYSQIFSTIPPEAYCHNASHDFPKVDIAIAEPVESLDVPNFVIYSGREQDRWYRMSNIFGTSWIEFGHSELHKYNGEMQLNNSYDVWTDQILFGCKPLGTLCDCFMNQGDAPVVRVGRFGTWDRRLLLHHVPEQVRQGLQHPGSRIV